MIWFCELSCSVQMFFVLVIWLGCLAELFLLLYHFFHRRAVWNAVADGALFCGSLILEHFLVGCRRGFFPVHLHLAVPVLAAVAAGMLLYAGISFVWEYGRSKREVNAWSIKEAMDDLPMGICFADESGRIILCNRMMDVLSHLLTGSHPQTMADLTGALKDLPGTRGVTEIPDVSDCFRFPDGRIYHFCRSDLDCRDLQGYTQLVVHDETEIYEVNIRIRESNRQLEEVNSKLQKMYERMADDVRKKESLDLKVWLHDILGRSLLTVQDVKNSSTSEARKKLKELKEAVGTLSANRPTAGGTFAEARQKAKQLGVRVSLNGYIPSDTAEERLIAAAVMECVTDCVRHAKGDAVYVRTYERAGIFVTEITNNGEPPKDKIIEGSGLSSLRRSVEASGGEMHVSHKPAFYLALYLPRKEKQL